MRKRLWLTTAVMVCAWLAASTTLAQNTPVPYTLSFVPVTSASLPALHSYCLANVSATQWLILGGRYQAGLHTFNPDGNFPNPNIYLWSVNPVTGISVQVADLSQLPLAIANPLTSTNQECAYNATTGYWYMIGGYGVARPGTDFQTFSTVTRVPVPQLLTIVNNTRLSPAQRQAAVMTLLSDSNNQITNPLLQVTGGALSQMASGLSFLSFGQVFTGSYNPFSTNPGFTQKYTQQIVPFALSNCNAPQGDGCALTVRTQSPITSTDPDQPFNRRDFTGSYDVDPATGQERYSIFGGVFRPGAIAAYDYPVYLTGSGFNVSATPDHSTHQHFGFYEEPVIVAWDGIRVYHTFFGGISHFFLNQTAAQAQVYALVTSEGRNDGLPFVQDIGTQIESSNGTYQEFVAPQGVPSGNLDGTSVDFVPNLADSAQMQGTDSTVINLASFQPGEKALIGYIYGGIEATYPLPCLPSHGTVAIGTLYKVYLTLTPWPGLLPASQMTEALGYSSHARDAKRGAMSKAVKATEKAAKKHRNAGLGAANPCSAELQQAMAAKTATATERPTAAK